MAKRKTAASEHSSSLRRSAKKNAGTGATDPASPLETSSMTDALRADQEGMQESERKFRLLARHAPVGIFLTDLHGDCEFVNERWCELTGVPPEDAMGRGWVRAVHPDDRDRVVKEWSAAVRSRQKFESTYRTLTPAGKLVWVAGSAMVLRDEAGQVFGFVGTVTDITEQRMAQEVLRNTCELLGLQMQEQTADLARAVEEVSSEAQNRVLAERRLGRQLKIIDAAFNYSMTPLVFLDREFNFLRVNDAFARACQRSIESFAGKNYFDLCPSDLRENFERAVRTKTPFRMASQPTTVPDHPEWSVTYWDWTLEPIPDDGGGVEILLLSMMDVTTRKRNEDSFRALNETLRQRTTQLRELAEELTQTEERERRRIAQSLHDNLQQLLVGAKFTLDVLASRNEETDLGAPLRSVADLMDQAITACGSLVLDLSPPILYDVGLGAALEWLGRRMQAKYGLKVQTEIEPDVEPKTRNVSVLLFQSVRELLINVMKHARAQAASLRMSRVRDDGIQITVQDDGIGFNPGQIKAAAGASGGLGLFSIRERLDLLGGQLVMESVPGRGTCMTLIAPLQAPDIAIAASEEARLWRVAAPAEVSALPHPSAALGPKVRVLLADDHEIVRHGLVELLLQFAPEIDVVAEASNGRMAVELAHLTQPDVVVMDVSMPELNGVEATRRIVTEHPNIKVIGLSMYAEADQAAAMREAGAVAYLHKAGATEDLIATILTCAQKQQ